MREIKFRIWDNSRKKFYYWGFLEDGIFAGCPSGSKLSLRDSKKLSEQFTGVQDKNGKDVYEGDIIEYYRHIILVKYGANQCDCEGDVVDVAYGWNIGCDSCNLKKLGNIHENADLLVNNT